MDYSLLVGVCNERFNIMKDAPLQRKHSNNFQNSLDGAPMWGRSLSVEVDRLRRHHHEHKISDASVSKRPDDSDPDPFQRDEDGGIHAKKVEGPGMYFIGIIDILQDYNLSKKLERFFKVYIQGADPDGLSSAPPTFFANRFWKRNVIELFEGIRVRDNTLFRESQEA